MNLPAKWRIVKEGILQYHAPGYAVYATVGFLNDNQWIWDCRIMWNCERPDKQRTSGVTTTMRGAMKVVEAICAETETCYPIDKNFINENEEVIEKFSNILKSYREQ